MNTTPAPGSFRDSFRTSARFWEWRRLPYNAVLASVVLIWVVGSWPHFRPAFNLMSLWFLVFMAGVANLCYCAAYLVDLPLQQSGLGTRWLRWRWGLWLLGTAFAVLLECYWIADEVYPYV